MLCQILIPTFNRRDDLKRNLIYLKDQLVRDHLTGKFAITVSNNASSDGTDAMLSELKVQWSTAVSLNIFNNKTNVGLEQNSVNLLCSTASDYVLWLGDDDLLADGYLKFVYDHIAQGEIGWVIPGLLEIDKYGKKHYGRLSTFESKMYSLGYRTVLELSHLGHQMSGLVVKRKELATVYLSHPNFRNPYLFIFFLAYSQLYNRGLYAPRYKTEVNNFNSKDWSYNDIGLLDEVFKSYYYLTSKIGVEKTKDILLKFVLMHSYRINFDKGFLFVIQQWKSIWKHSELRLKGFSRALLVLLTKEYFVRKMQRSTWWLHGK